jgi:hypothetical protein
MPPARDSSSIFAIAWMQQHIVWDYKLTVYNNGVQVSLVVPRACLTGLPPLERSAKKRAEVQRYELIASAPRCIGVHSAFLAGFDVPSTLHRLLLEITLVAVQKRHSHACSLPGP